MTRLNQAFFTRTDVVQIARELLGTVLVSTFDGMRTAGIITETEAYRAPDDRACHAFGNRRTARTEVMFHEGGVAYVYLCYGIHHLFNVVTGPGEMAQAVLIRAIQPVEGLDVMLLRRNWSPQKYARNPVPLTTGPGALTQAMGIHTNFSGKSLLHADSQVWVEQNGKKLSAGEIATGKRIGVDYAAECADWPWRFWIQGSPWRK